MKGLQDTIVQKTTKVIWSISHAMSFVCLCVVVFLFSCSQDNETEDSNLLLGENESCFTEKLVSITRNGEYYYIGTESSGHVFVYSAKEGDVIDTLNTDYGRIYQVKKLHETDTFFVGTQNMGLKKTHQRGESLITDITYKIRGKDNRYSCYDIFFDNDTVYAMTSHGIYYVGKSDTLQSVFPKHDQNVVPNPLVANNMVKPNGYLFAATDSGVVVIKNLEVVDTIAEKIKIKNVAYHDSIIYALGDCLYKVDPDSLKIVDTVKLKVPARYYFYADSIHHFLSESCMILAHDSVLHKPEQHKQVNTRRKLSLEGHNVIADGKEYSLLVAENALWQVGHHYPSVFGNLKKEGGVKLACTDRKSAYFLVGKKVYKLAANNVAEEVLELKEDGEIKLMECKQDSDKQNRGIYYVNSDNCVYFQRFNQEEPEFIGKSDKEITAMCIHNLVGNGVILGVRDGLLYMEKKKVPEPITLEMNNGNKDTIPYIRRFAVTASNYYVPTMNEGIFYGSGKGLRYHEESRSIQFIRDVVCPDSAQAANLFWLTNKYLYLSGDDSIINRNYGSRLFVSSWNSGNVVCIPGELGGVRVLRLNKKDLILNDTILFSDMAFRPESSLMLKNTLFLGGQSGIIAFNTKEIFDKNESLKYHYVEFKDKEERQSVVIYLPFLAVLIIVIIYYVRYRVNKKVGERVRSRIEHLKQRSDGIKSQLDNDGGAADKFQTDMESISTRIAKIQEASPESVSDDELNEISKAIICLDKHLHEYQNEKIKEIEDVRLENVKDHLSKDLNIFESSLQENEVVKKVFRNHLQSIRERIDNLTSYDQKDEISETISTLNKNKSKLSGLRDEYIDAAEKNKSKEVEIEASEDLNFVFKEYEKLLETEKAFARYRVILEKKEKSLKDIAYSIVDIIDEKESIKIIKMCRDVLGKTNMTSKDKIEELNKKIEYYQKLLINRIKYHVGDKLNSISGLLKEEDNDKDILERLKKVYDQQKANVESLSGKDGPTVFNIIELITKNDGRLEMVVQMRKIRNEVKKGKKKELKNAIDSFCRPVIAYHVDRKIYDELMEIIKDEPNSPKGIRGKKTILNQPFVILAMAMAKSKLPEKNFLISFFKSKDYNKDYEDSIKDDIRFIDKSIDFTIKWINDDYSNNLRKEIEKANRKDPLSLYYSVTAYYLSQLAESK